MKFLRLALAGTFLTVAGSYSGNAYADNKTTNHSCSGHVFDSRNDLIRKIKISFGSTEVSGHELAIVEFGKDVYATENVYGLATCKISEAGISECQATRTSSDETLPEALNFSRTSNGLVFGEGSNFLATSQVSCKANSVEFDVLSVTYEGTAKNPVQIGVKVIIQPKEEDVQTIKECSGLVRGFNSAKGWIYGGQFTNEKCQVLPGPTRETLTLWMSGAMAQDQLEGGYYYLDTIWLRTTDSRWPMLGYPRGLKGFVVNK